jgi:adenine phosphoribosyltransferase
MSLLQELKSLIRDIPNFPKHGILFRDFTPLIEDARAFRATVDLFAERYRERGVQKVVCVESRGFIVGAPLAVAIEAGCVIVRKPGKLPYETERVTYDLEYGTDTLEIHKGAIKKGEKVVIIDDLLATGGTMAATRTLVENQGGRILEAAFIIELHALNGRKKLEGIPVHSLIQY